MSAARAAARAWPAWQAVRGALPYWDGLPQTTRAGIADDVEALAAGRPTVYVVGPGWEAFADALPARWRPPRARR